MTMDFDTGEVKTLLAGNVQSAAWSPDGSRIALVRDQKLDVFDPVTGAVTPVAPDLNAAPYPNVYGPAGSLAWSPDSSRIAFTALASENPGTGSIYTVNADGSGLSGPLSGSQGMGFLSFSPDGKYLAATTSESAKVIDPQTGEEKISYGDRVGRAPIWVDSQTLLVSDDSSGIEAVGLDGSVQYLIGGTIPCYPGLVAWVGGKIFFSEICAIPGL
jgi:Tol biopolymer transport system component